jgi:hypothetical protein
VIRSHFSSLASALDACAAEKHGDTPPVGAYMKGIGISEPLKSVRLLRIANVGESVRSIDSTSVSS